MTNGRLGSCADHTIPVSEIFELSYAMQPTNGCPLMVPYQEYMEFCSTTTSNNTTTIEHGVCTSKLKDQKCSPGTKMPAKINQSTFRNDTVNSSKSDLAIIRVEHYWAHHSIGYLANLLGKKMPKLKHLEFHPQHVNTIKDVLRKSNVSDDNFSVIHFRAEKDGMDYTKCA